MNKDIQTSKHLHTQIYKYSNICFLKTGVPQRSPDQTYKLQIDEKDVVFVLLFW